MVLKIERIEKRGKFWNLLSAPRGLPRKRSCPDRIPTPHPTFWRLGRAKRGDLGGPKIEEKRFYHFEDVIRAFFGMCCAQIGIRYVLSWYKGTRKGALCGMNVGFQRPKMFCANFEACQRQVRLCQNSYRVSKNKTKQFKHAGPFWVPWGRNWSELLLANTVPG